MDGDSGRRPLIERPPLRSLGPVLALAESSAPRTDWLLRGQLVVLGKGGVRHSRASGGSRPLCLRGQWFAASHRVLWLRSVVLGSCIGLAPLQLAAASQVLFGAQGAGLSDQGEGDPLHQVLVQWSLAPAV